MSQVQVRIGLAFRLGNSNSTIVRDLIGATLLADGCHVDFVSTRTLAPGLACHYEVLRV